METSQKKDSDTLIDILNKYLTNVTKSSEINIYKGGYTEFSVKNTNKPTLDVSSLFGAIGYYRFKISGSIHDNHVPYSVFKEMLGKVEKKLTEII